MQIKSFHQFESCRRRHIPRRCNRLDLAYRVPRVKRKSRRRRKDVDSTGTVVLLYPPRPIVEQDLWFFAVWEVMKVRCWVALGGTRRLVKINKYSNIYLSYRQRQLIKRVSERKRSSKIGHETGRT